MSASTLVLLNSSISTVFARISKIESQEIITPEDQVKLDSLDVQFSKLCAERTEIENHMNSSVG